MSFSSLGLNEEILKAIKDLYYKKPTEIQSKAIPVALQGKDVIGQAPTGTGKSAAFLLPTIQKIKEQVKDIQVLILSPTRELALQLYRDAQEYAKYKEVNFLLLQGGTDIQTQMNKLKGHIHVVIGTPGRVLDLLQREALHFGRIHTLILDEADKMLELGFYEDIEEIFKQTAVNKQVLFFSATFPDRVKQLAQLYLKNPVHIRIGQEQKTPASVKQAYYVVNQSEKLNCLISALNETKPFLSIIFVKSQQRAEWVAKELEKEGFDTEWLHGALTQRKRQRIMQQFREMKFQHLICTDIAARGVDVEGVTHVFNYDLPGDMESYIHRIGRTGRAGDVGLAISFVSPRQKSIITKYASYLSTTIEERIWNSHTKRVEAPVKRVKQLKRNVRPVQNEGQSTKAEGNKDKKEKVIPVPLKELNPKLRKTVKEGKTKPGYKKKLNKAIEKYQSKKKRAARGKKR